MIYMPREKKSSDEGRSETREALWHDYFRVECVQDRDDKYAPTFFAHMHLRNRMLGIEEFDVNRRGLKSREQLLKMFLDRQFPFFSLCRAPSTFSIRALPSMTYTIEPTHHVQKKKCSPRLNAASFLGLSQHLLMFTCPFDTQ